MQIYIKVNNLHLFSIFLSTSIGSLLRNIESTLCMFYIGDRHDPVEVLDYHLGQAHSLSNIRTAVVGVNL